MDRGHQPATTVLAPGRLVDTWGLVDKDDIWYLLGGIESGQRTFRIDRIIAAEPAGQPAERPDDFALAAAWEQIVGEVEQQRSRTWATVLVEGRFVPVLQTQFGRHCHTDGEPGRGRARVRVGAPTPPDIARRLAGWGAMIEVTDPKCSSNSPVARDDTTGYHCDITFPRQGNGGQQ